jgi:hypothetical protein
MSENANFVRSKPKHSSLKDSTPLDKNKIMPNPKKRNSVSFLVANELKFLNQKGNIEEHEKKFEELRRKSVKNEFSIAKELLRNDKDIQEIEAEKRDEIKENTYKNGIVGKENGF